jgi:hypothetical protein
MDTRPWDRLADETPRAYEAFLRYAGMGPARSMAAVAGPGAGQPGASTGQGPGKGAPGYITHWAHRHNWTGRAAAYDGHLAEQRRRLMEDAARKQAEEEAEDWAKFGRDYAQALRASFLLAAGAQNELVAASEVDPEGHLTGVDLQI